MKRNPFYFYYYLTFLLSSRDGEKNRERPISFIAALLFTNVISLCILLGYSPLKGMGRNGVWGTCVIGGFIIYFILSYFLVKKNKNRDIIRFYNSLYKDKKLPAISIWAMVIYYVLTFSAFGYAMYLLYQSSHEVTLIHPIGVLN